ncbi:type II secretion system F family protein [Micromonospora echinofusca]|uniref:Flp pilus assembly protein TadB n=1 Tax=Micromonospora echinofusca TaxID=47858 RepID=A0A1C5GGD2_MICEH|nr:Flp pilus assembly protein TadB [Micromonospora echinofusca]
MPRLTLVVGLVVAVALLAATLAAGRRPLRRLRALRRAPVGVHPAAPPRLPAGPGDAATDGARPRRRPDAIRVASGLGGVAVVVVVGGWPGVVAALPTTLLLDRLLRRIEPPAVRNRRLREAADLPLAADLLAAAMRAGAPVDRSVLAVAGALDGPLADRLARVGRLLRLGGGPEEAWAPLAAVPGADRLTAAVLRSANSGAALAGALTRLADDLRADRATAAEAAARRAGVLIVLPLGLCFLPAFILAGLVPVIVAVLGDVL